MSMRNGLLAVASLRRLRPFALGLAFVSGLAAAGGAQERPVSLAFTGPGRLAVLGRGPGGEIVLERRAAGTEARSVRALDISGARHVSNPVLVKDRSGSLYLVWEEPGREHSRVGFGRLAENGAVKPESVSQPPGWNGLPSLAFDARNVPWLVWVNDGVEEQTLLARQTLSGRTWTLAAAGAMLAPKVLGDAAGRVWVFWGETGPAEYRILFRVFDGLRWSPARTAWEAGPAVVQSFSAAVDDFGSAWVVWSQFAAGHYGIYARRLVRDGWSATVPLSPAGDPAENMAPSLGLAPGLGPIAAWVRADGRTDEFCLRAFALDQWGPVRVVPGVDARESLPRMTVEDGSVGIAWVARDSLQSRVLPLQKIPGLPAPEFPAAPGRLRPDAEYRIRSLLSKLPSIIYNPELDESAYIAYGDSITLGVIDSEYHPALGYVPRLEALLTEDFGPTEVINEGVGSQITMNGLAHLDGILEADLARYILILEGTNDTVTLIYNPDVTGSNLQEMVRRSRAFGSYAALGTLLPRYDVDARPERIIEVNSRIREFADVLAVPLVDFYTLFTDYPESEGGVLSLLSEDLLHPNEKGYQFMAQNWYETIRDFPFPPVGITIRREYDKIFFYQKPGNMIDWEANPKIHDPATIQGYRLYRKLSAAGDDTFELIVTVEGNLQYFDTAISPDKEYTYVISTVTTEGREGPASSPVTF
jgi:lysophospholipase L1-like esterase